jgi:uncharacterized protein GlcG (DUF336 family)
MERNSSLLGIRFVRQNKAAALRVGNGTFGPSNLSQCPLRRRQAFVSTDASIPQGGEPDIQLKLQNGKGRIAMNINSMSACRFIVSSLAIGLATAALAAPNEPANRSLPSHQELKTALSNVVASTNSGGFALNMWATIVNRDGEVVAVAFSGEERGDQWPGSRVISAQKANTANAFSLPGLALSTANLYSAVQPGGSLYGLQHSNPVDVDVAYGGQSKNNGQKNDFMVGRKIGGVNVFGGGLALYDRDGKLVGAIGVSGDTSCTDHIVAWKVRHALNLDNVPAGVAPGAANGTDNIIFDITTDAAGHEKSASGWGQPLCPGTPASAIAGALPTSHPVGPNP